MIMKHGKVTGQTFVLVFRSDPLSTGQSYMRVIRFLILKYCLLDLIISSKLLET